MVRLILFALFNFFIVCAHADYRVYELKITKPEAQDVRLVRSTLDHIQYQTYYPVMPGERVTYVQSWKCKGNFSYFSDYCVNPRAPNQSP